jgi:di/tricarboxylate transporter
MAQQVIARYRFALNFLILSVIGAVAFVAGMLWSNRASAEETATPPKTAKHSPKIVYPSKTELLRDVILSK